MDSYCIKDGYIARSGYTHYDDTGLSDEYQLEVYVHALGLMKKHGLQSVLDIGCGSGYKLMTYLGEYQTTGVELPVNMGFLRSKYPGRTWATADFSETWEQSVDLVICSDVVEHLPDPDQLMNFIARINFKFLVISTPERDLLYHGGRQGFNGPPGNLAHVREWNKPEFAQYIARWFQLSYHRVCNLEQFTQMVTAHK